MEGIRSHVRPSPLVQRTRDWGRLDVGGGINLPQSQRQGLLSPAAGGEEGQGQAAEPEVGLGLELDGVEVVEVVAEAALLDSVLAAGTLEVLEARLSVR